MDTVLTKIYINSTIPFFQNLTQILERKRDNGSLLTAFCSYLIQPNELIDNYHIKKCLMNYCLNKQPPKSDKKRNKIVQNFDSVIEKEGKLRSQEYKLKGFGSGG